MLAKKVLHFLTGRLLVKPDEPILVAYSAGTDSTALLHLLRENWKTCAAVYVNHNLRSEESEREERLARRFCAELDLPLFVETIQWKTKPANLEEAARKRRYRHLAKVAAEQGFNRVALAHQKEDVTETFLLRLLRGSGPAGLASIPPKRGIYIRPLLECSRSEILRYLDYHGLPYFTDTTNASLEFQRNRIRNELIPYLKSHFNPAIVDALWKSSRWLLEQNALVRELLQPYESLLNRTKDGVALDRSRFLQLSHPLRKAVLRLAIHDADPALSPPARTLHSALDAIVDAKDFQLPGYLQIHTAAEKIWLIRKEIPGASEIDVPHEGSFLFPPANRILSFQTCEHGEISKERNVAFLDASKASFPLYLRNMRRGDSFQPLGMSGHKKLSDFFIDRKIPRLERKRIPLVLKDEAIVWVAGYQIDNEFRVTEKTDRILRIEIRDDV